MTQLEISVIGGIITFLIVALITYVWRKTTRWGRRVIEKLEMLDHIPSLELQVIGHEERLRDHGERISTLEGATRPRDST